MKKMIFVLAILLMAVPAMAQTVTISATCEVWDGNGLVTISYDANGAPDPCEIRAFALDITVDNDGVIEDAWNESDDYWVFPGTYDDDWSVVAPSDDPGALGGLGTGGITTEQGSLFAEGEKEPNDTGDLLQFTVSGEGTICVSIAANTTRAGVVNRANPGTPPDITFKGCCVELVGAACGNLTPEQTETWEGWGAPAPQNWCGLCWRCGDVNVDGFVTFGDVVATFNYFKDSTSNGEGDVNMDGFETFGDVIEAFNLFKSGQGCTPAYCQ
ncbi:hypothetical protein ACFL1G_06350 [Planctomycetota bacterium]